jgi:hypothetical protein
MTPNEIKTLDHRDILSITLIIGALLIIAIFTIIPLSKEGLSTDDFKYTLNVIIPLLATWIGTILAFYYGRENFEAASKQYKSIINQLTPEILDDIEVNQIMIDKDTMVWREYASIQNNDIKTLSDFLKDVGKNRLPILNNQQIMYVVHKSTFDEEITLNLNQIQPNFSAFEVNPKYSNIIKSFIKVPNNTKLEQVLEKLKSDEKIQDVFVEENGKVIGWLPNSLINRYLMKK